MGYKYRFITIAHNLQLESVKNKGMEVFSRARVTNSKQILDKLLKNDLVTSTLGVHSIDEFYKSSAYVYVDGDFNDVQSKEKVDEIGTKYTFYLLREVQFFMHKLWELKDNSIYIRDGFLIVYKNYFEDGFTFKASLSEIFSHSTGDSILTKYTDSEILSAKSKFTRSEFEDYTEESFGGKIPDSNHLFKSCGSERLTRSL